jgi:oxygen-independent coproporphyrinogen-3 oxidase
MTLEDDPAAFLYEMTEELMQNAGLPAYEVSNYAQPMQECRHNLLYWNFEDYIGIGPGAHGRISTEGNKWATTRYKAPETWLNTVEAHGHGQQASQLLSPLEKLHELTLMGLRLTKGLEIKRIKEETGLEIHQSYRLHDLDLLEKEGLLKRTDSHLIPTFEGRLRLNSLIAFLLQGSRSS